MRIASSLTEISVANLLCDATEMVPLPIHKVSKKTNATASDTDGCTSFVGSEMRKQPGIA